MRFSPALCSLFVVLIVGAIPVCAQEVSLQARIAARRDLELAKIDLRNYWQVDYPRQKRDLDAAIELTEDEIRNNESLELEYRPYTSFSLGEPFPITIRNLRMCRKEAEVRLKNLQAERNMLIRFHDDQFHLLELKVVEARLRVAALEANDVVTAQPVKRP